MQARTVEKERDCASRDELINDLRSLCKVHRGERNYPLEDFDTLAISFIWTRGVCGCLKVIEI